MLSKFISSFSSPLDKKIEESFRVINLAYAKYRQNLCICFNGGKDSTVLLDLIYRFHTETKVGQNYPLRSFYLKSNDEFPEMAKYISNDVVKNWKHDLITIESSSLKNGLTEMINKYGTKAVFLGVRNSDPEGKNVKFFEHTTLGWPSAVRVMPLLQWNYKDIWNYLDKLNLPVCELYSKGFTSIGSPSKTSPNPHLFISTTNSYQHARELANDSLERAGRN